MENATETHERGGLHLHGDRHTSELRGSKRTETQCSLWSPAEEMKDLQEVWVGSYHVGAGTSKMASVGVGGYVCCFVNAQSMEVAREAMRAALDDDGYTVREEEFVRAYAETYWGAHQSEFDALAVRVQRDRGVVYSEFYTYKSSGDGI